MSESTQEISTTLLEHQLTDHFRSGNDRLKQQGFIPERNLTRYLVFDEDATGGLSEMISSTLEEFHRRGQVKEDVLILVGERQYLDGILYTVVYSTLNPYTAFWNRNTSQSQPITSLKVLGI